LRDRRRLIGKIDVTNTPQRSADPYHNEQDRKYNEDKATFCETAHPSFRRRLNLGVHFRDSMWILVRATISFSYRLRNASQSICIQLRTGIKRCHVAGGIVKESINTVGRVIEADGIPIGRASAGGGVPAAITVP